MNPIHAAALAALFTTSCHVVTGPPPVDRDGVTVAVLAMAEQICGDLATAGPQAWLDHFEDADGFFMASDGELLFPDFATAAKFIAQFDPTIESMELEWVEPRVEPTTHGQAVLHSTYREVLVGVDGQAVQFGGYFTALVVRSGDRWRIRNAHWSSPRRVADR